MAAVRLLSCFAASVAPLRFKISLYIIYIMQLHTLREDGNTMAGVKAMLWREGELDLVHPSQFFEIRNTYLLCFQHSVMNSRGSINALLSTLWLFVSPLLSISILMGRLLIILEFHLRNGSHMGLGILL
jgi:hypothetical protein